MYTVTEIEDAILATLRADATLNGYVKVFEPLPSVDDKDIRHILLRAPAIGTMPGPGTFGDEMTGKMDETGTFIVLAFNRNLRKITASLRGDDASPGCWDMIDDARRVLKDTRLGLSIIDCTPRSRDLLFANKDGAACALNVEIKWRHSA